MGVAAIGLALKIEMMQMLFIIPYHAIPRAQRKCSFRSFAFEYRRNICFGFDFRLHAHTVIVCLCFVQHPSPKVVWNAATQLYVLWINYLPPASSPLEAYPNATYVVATSSNPAGPFEVGTQRAAISATGGGDFDIMVSESIHTSTRVCQCGAIGVLCDGNC